MTAIQAIHIRNHEERSDPKPHVVYRIEIQAPVRSWQMWRRYSEFEDLHTELTKVTGSEPPAPLPPKHRFSLLRSRNDAGLLEERRAGLEAYLRAIISSKDERWRECYAFKDFLGVPVGKQAGMEGGLLSPTQFTSASWLDEHMELQARLRDVRADINKRDALADRSDPSGAHKANVEAKKKLAGVITRAGALGKGLAELGMRGMSEGELQRRTDMVARLQDDCEKLSKMVTVARMTSRGLGATAAQRNPAADGDRAALLGGVSSSSGTGTGFRNAPVTRVFGAKPVETEETRPLDDHGVFQLQADKMEQQDVQVSQMTSVLQRLKHLGLAIHQEISEQNELLDDLTNDVDRTGDKLTAAKKKLNRLG
ncbi:syntaxin [Heliocybe sulcata]|uniref:Syntaxin n=1 Tax=Heliocybe sulcata TaxID=5364 RepID=A0A5C3NL78_9AGAM|nr:syntaxin [Heliocybe sulcata]